MQVSDSSTKVTDLPIGGEKVSWHPGPLPEEGRSPREGEKLSCQVMLSSSLGPVCPPPLPPGAREHPITAVISSGAGVQGLAVGMWQWQEIVALGAWEALQSSDGCSVMGLPMRVGP